jgi:ribosomal protein S19
MRSKWKLPFLNFLFLRKIKKKNDQQKKEKKKEILITKSRGMVITPGLVNFKVKIYNGIKYTTLDIKEFHIGYKFGNFTITKKRCIFKKKKKTNQEKKKWLKKLTH